MTENERYLILWKLETIFIPCGNYVHFTLTVKLKISEIVLTL